MGKSNPESLKCGERIKSISTILYCGKCGGRMTTPFNHSINYKCQCCEFEMQIPLVILQNLIHLSKEFVTENRDNQAVYSYNETVEIINVDNDISTVISTRNADYDYIRQMIFESAALKYRSVSESPKEEIKFEISELESFKLRRKEKPSMDDIERFFETAGWVIIDEQSIRIILKRGE